MKDYLERLPKNILELVEAARKVARDLNYKVYLVGGFVRDLILGVNNFDLDIVVEGDGIKFAEALAKELNAKVISYKRFGTATVILQFCLNSKCARTIDIATARKEFYPKPGSLPVVSKGVLKDDLFRRDFTINTLAISLNRENFAQLIDLFKGKFDISRKKVRILHNLSFLDDPTRILRAVRFVRRYDFRITPETLKCLNQALRRKILFEVSPQRLRDEFILIFKEKEPLKVLKYLAELVGLKFISPGLKLSLKTEKYLELVQDEVQWFKTEFPADQDFDVWLVYWAGLMRGLNIKQARVVCDRFVLRNDQKKKILDFFLKRDKLISRLSHSGLKPSSIFHLLKPLSREVIILLKASTRDKRVLDYIEKFFYIYRGISITLKGQDLNDLGFIPGAYYQKIFREVLNAKLNGKIKTAREELEYAKKGARPRV